MLRCCVRQGWKQKTGPIGSELPAFEQVPAKAALRAGLHVPPPVLQIARLDESNGTFSIPQETRAQFLTCPIRAPSWKTLLTRFDSVFGIDSAPNSAALVPRNAVGGGAPPAPVPDAVPVPVPDAEFSWAQLFQGSAVTIQAS